MLCFSPNSIQRRESTCLGILSLLWFVTLALRGDSQDILAVENLRATAGCSDSERNQAIVATDGVLSCIPLEAAAISKSAIRLNLETPSERFLSGREISPSRAIAVPVGKIIKIELSPNRDMLLVAGGEPGQRGAVQCLEWPTGKLGELMELGVDQTPISDMVTDVSWFPSSERWVESHWGSMVLVRRRDGSVLGHFSGHTGPVLQAIPWTDELAISAGVDQTIKIWRIANGELVQNLSNHTAPVVGLASWIGQEGKPLLLSLGQDRTLRLWDPLVGRLIRFVKLPDLPVSMEISRSGWLAVLLQNNSVVRVTLPMLKIEETVPLEAPRATRMVRSEEGVWYYW